MYRGRKTYQVHVGDSRGLLSNEIFSADVDGKSVLYGTVSNGVDTYYDPAMEIPFSLKLNEPYTVSFVGHTIVGRAEQLTPSNQTITYAGRETLKAALGTFETCRFEHKNLDEGGLWTEWVVATGKLRGLPVQWASGTVVTNPVRIEVSW